MLYKVSRQLWKSQVSIQRLQKQWKMRIFEHFVKVVAFRFCSKFVQNDKFLQNIWRQSFFETDERMNTWGWADELKWMSGWADEHLRGWADERMNTWVDERMSGWTLEGMSGWADEHLRMSGWAKRWADEHLRRMSGWTDEPHGVNKNSA